MEFESIPFPSVDQIGIVVRDVEATARAYEPFLGKDAFNIIEGEAPATLDNIGDPAFCTIWSLCGAPALTIPTGFGPNRLPLGLQVVGRLYDDARLLGVARWCAGAIGFDIGFPDA